MKLSIETFTETEHARWAKLTKRLFVKLDRANAEYKEGLSQIDLNMEEIPSFEELNYKLERCSGWRYAVAKEHSTNEEFMLALSNKTFLSSDHIRLEEEMDFCKLPDIFHDIFGHAALLANIKFGDFLEQLGFLSIKYAGIAKVQDYLSRIYWYTAEVGLVTENRQIHYYGGSIISSVSEIDTVLKGEVPIYDFDVSHICNTPYDSFSVNSCYFIVNHLAVLNQSIKAIEEYIENKLSK